MLAGHTGGVTGELVGTLLLPSIDAAAFSPDGRMVATVHGSIVYLWVGTDRVAALCERIGRTITPAEWEAYVPDLPHNPVC